MLSITNTITDAKLEIEEYGVYGYESDLDFVSVLDYVSGIAKRDRMLSLLGETEYARIEAKDKIDLSLKEEYIYYAEIYYILSEFFLYLARKDKHRRKNITESVSQSGVTRSTSGILGNEMAAQDYKMKADRSLDRAGYDTSMKLIRNRSVYDAIDEYTADENS